MTTKFVGVKEFRANMAGYAAKARQRKARYIVVSRNKPLFEVSPFAADATLDSLFTEVAKAERDVRAGRYYTQEEVLRDLA